MNKKQLYVLWGMGIVFLVWYFNLRVDRGDSVPGLGQVLSMLVPIAVVGWILIITFASKGQK